MAVRTLAVLVSGRLSGRSPNAVGRASARLEFRVEPLGRREPRFLARVQVAPQLRLCLQQLLQPLLRLLAVEIRIRELGLDFLPSALELGNACFTARHFGA